MIELKHITKVYGNFKALDDVSVTIRDGEIYGIVGQSGAGKSTLVRCINMLEPPTTGEVLINGKDMMKLSKAELRSERKGIGMIFQHFNLLSSRTVAGNIAFPLELANVPKAEQKKRIDDILDEATSALDPETVKSILQLLKDINKKLGITIIMITHQMEVIKEIAERVAVIEHGRIIEEGSVVDLFTNPQTPTLKKFVGSVMSSEVPEQLSHMDIHADKENADDQTVLSLSFRGDVANEPIIANLIKKYNLDVSILYGSIDYIQNVSFGRLIITIIGDDSDMQEALSHLKSLPITSEVLGYVSSH